MRLLPIGIQDFAKMREGGFVYADKTAWVHRLISESAGAVFLSRPRRFGKSLLCSTLGAIFEGRRELFGEIAGRPALAIDSFDWEWKVHPVVRLDLNPGGYMSGGITELHANLNRNMEFCAEKYGVPFTGETLTDKFVRLIHNLRERCGQRVVVIVDEYDKPMLDTMEDRQLCVAMRTELKGFYGALKSSDANLRLVFLTGITRFSSVSVFSDLNHLNDITLNRRYADICGLTQQELELDFGPEIDGVLEETGRDRETYMEDLRLFYNGYRFSRKPLKVYNPFGILQHFSGEGEFSPYWYETASPRFLINLVASQKINLLNLGDLSLRVEDFRKYDIEDLEAVPLMYQTGYLTISGYDEERNRYTLDYPNLEVRSSFATSLVRRYMKIPEDRSKALILKLPDALQDGDIDGAMDALRQFLAVIPYDIIRETENYYHTAVHLIFTMLGFNCRSEVRIAAGRIDSLVETKNFVYCFEFKLDKSADAALAQIDTKEYMLPWVGSGKKLFKVGVDFNREERNIGEWKYAVVEK